VYVAWQNGVAGDKNIKLVNSTTSGSPGSFNDIRDVSRTSSANSVVPKLAEDDGIIHVAWLEDVSGTQQVFVASSGTSYTPVAVSPGSTATGHQIIADGVNVFTVWQDKLGGPTHEILFSNSTDSGVTFGTPINLSDSSGDSTIPKLSGNSTHVNVVWRDNTFLPEDIPTNVDGQVWFKSSSDSGVSFGGLQVISETTGITTNTFLADFKVEPTTNPAPVPNISSFGNVVVAVWNPDPTRAGDFTNAEKWQGSLKAATASKLDISFNSTEYLSPGFATITVVDLSQTGMGPVSVNVLGDSMTTKSPVSLAEIGSSGTFSAEIELGDSTFKGELGDIFTANYTLSGSTITTQAKIQDTRTLDFLTEGNAAGVFVHDIGDIVGLRLFDTGSNSTDEVETVDVTITSPADTDGVTLTLTETGPKTATFEIRNSLVFMNGTFTPSVNDSITITKTKTIGTDDDAIETIDQKVTTTKFLHWNCLYL